jgi:sigma-E factor negative regulatory protein RseA
MMNTHEKVDTTMQSQAEIRVAPQDDRYRNLSALIDGELDHDAAWQAIRNCVDEPEMRARHSEYLAIGDAMRGLSGQHDGFTRRVMAAIENEPVVLAPLPRKPERRPALWLAAAAAAAITWGLWHSTPQPGDPAPMAAGQPATTPTLEAMPYLAAHQDFSQAVISTQEVSFVKAALEVPR